MKILIISNGHSSSKDGVHVSGGDVRWIEIAKIWKKMGHSINILTTKNGIQLCNKMGLNSEFHLLEDIKTKSMISMYIYRAIKSTFALPSSLDDFKPDLIYSVTEHYYDVAPALILKKRKNCRWVSVVHWVAPIKRRGKLVTNILFFLQQRLGLVLIKKYADAVLAVSLSTRDSLLELGFKSPNVFAVDCGVDWFGIHDIVNKYKNSPKIYDAAFMKRLHSAKGVFDLIDIWSKVVEIKSNAKLMVIGGGSEKIEQELRELVVARGLSENVKFMGNVYDFDEKIRFLLQCNLFILPTYEENWAIVIGEALTCGLPTICYQLSEIVPIWNESVFWVQKGNTKAFSDTILDLLSQKGRFGDISNHGMSYTRKFDWSIVGMNELLLSFEGKKIVDPRLKE